MKKHLLIIVGLLLGNFLGAQNFDVQHYEINLSVPDSYSKYLEANTLVEIKILNDNVSELELMLIDLTVDSILIGTSLQNFEHNDTIIKIQLNTTYQTDDILTLSIYYHGYPHTDTDGWGGYFSKEGYIFNLGVSMSADPHNYGRAWYPCVDNFTDKASYLFNITCQDQRTAICGGTLINEIDNGDGTKTFSWLLNKPTPTYLTSVAIGNYEVYRDTLMLY
jgi:aminopeptidase N